MVAEKTINEKITITMDEACTILGISKDLMLRLIRTKDFPCIKFRKKVVINKSKFLKWIDDHSNGGRIAIY